jgi:hypothetical protein
LITAFNEHSQIAAWPLGVGANGCDDAAGAKKHPQTLVKFGDAVRMRRFGAWRTHG